MTIVLQRVYDEEPHAGYRVLVDRLWPRGVTKDHAALDEWCKDLAPSTDLRKWFDHDPDKWALFSTEYTAELQQHKKEAHALLARAGKKKLVLVYGAKDTKHTHALVLKDYLASL